MNQLMGLPSTGIGRAARHLANGWGAATIWLAAGLFMGCAAGGAPTGPLGNLGGDATINGNDTSDSDQSLSADGSPSGIDTFVKPECAKPADCDDGDACTADTCVPSTQKCSHLKLSGCGINAKPCGGNGDCAQPLVCDITRHACVGCLGHGDCGVGNRCVEQQCVASQPCASDIQCKAVNGLCDTKAGVCVPCLMDSDCGKGQRCASQGCETATPCVSSKDCPAVCSPTLGICVGCLTNSDCAVGQWCTQWQTCRPVVCAGAACSSTQLWTCAASGGAYEGGTTCSDGNPCTQDGCSNGKCAYQGSSGPEPSCDDGNPCTADQCGNGTCVHKAVASGTSCGPAKACTASSTCACADPLKGGLNCTQCLDPKKTGLKCDQCVDPAKVGTDCNQCADPKKKGANCSQCVDPNAIAPTCSSPACSPACGSAEYCDKGTQPPSCKAATCKFPTSWGKDVQKFSKLAIAPATVGCDLDLDGQPNNSLAAGFAALVKQSNDQIVSSLADGSLVILLETSGFAVDGSEFAGHQLRGSLAPDNSTCDPVSSSANCKYLVAATSYSPQSSLAICPAVTSFSNMKVDQFGKLTGGGDKQISSMYLPMAGVVLEVQTSKVALQGKVSASGSWDSTSEGLLCGVVSLTDLTAALLTIESLKDFVPIIKALLKPDIDVDGDGKKESVSFAYIFETVKGQISGLSP